jgi:hypothetical protein
MRGFASASWLNAIGAQYRIDPEYFGRHLDFMHTTDYHDLPSLPSSNQNIVRLRLTDVFVRQATIPRSEVLQARERENSSIKGYLKRLGRNNFVGESVVRRLSVHTETMFTIEHDISICVKGSTKLSGDSLSGAINIDVRW